MCFSASASFGAGVVLSVIGVASIRKVQHPSQIFFASVPLIFAIQQIAEGFLWVTLPLPEYRVTQKVITYFFLFFAQVVWPVWVPLALLFLERERTRKKAQKVFVGIGALVSCYLAYCMLSYHVQAKIVGYHVAYEQDFPPLFRNYVGALYVIATIVPPFLSHIRRMWILGLATLISYIVTTIFYDSYLVSVWCFFASVISMSIYVVILEIKKMHIDNQGGHLKRGS